MVDVCLLGCGGMMPLPHRRLSALLYRFEGRMILIDCGEGTQVSVKQTGWGFKSIDAVLFTHFHADHISGLPGFLLTLGNSGRTEPLTLAGPPGLAAVVADLCVIAPNLPFHLKIIELSVSEICELPIGQVVVKSLPVDHTVSCLAYRLDIKRTGVFDIHRANEQHIPIVFWKALQNGESVEDGNAHYEPGMVLGPPRRGISVTYCTDTRPVPELIPFCADSDFLICEGLYAEDEKRQSAQEKQHMIFSEAAEIANEARVKELWLTHYSPSLKNPEEEVINVKHIFSNIHAGYDLKTETIRYAD